MRKILSSLRGRLMILVMLTSIPVLFLLILVGMEQRQHAVNDAQAEVVRLARIAASREAELISTAQSFLLLLANLPEMRTLDLGGCTDLLTNIVSDHYKYYASFWVADLEGHVVCSPPGKHTPQDFDTCEHYTNLISSPTDDFVLSNYHVCEHTGKAVLSIGLPINNYDEERVLVSSIILDLAWIYDFASDVGLPDGAELTVLDRQGTILTHFPDNDRWRGYKFPTDLLQATLVEENIDGVIVMPDLHGTESIIAYSPLSNTDDQIKVVLAYPTKLAFQAANRGLARNIIILLVVILTTAGVIWATTSELFLRPIGHLVKATQGLAKGDLTIRSELDYSQTELGQLARAFDSMAAELNWREAERARHLSELSEYARNLETSNQELSDFASIAAHDLREPLRKIITFNDLLQTRHADLLDNEGTGYIARIQNTAQRMLMLLDDLRAYSRVTLKAMPFGKVDLNRVANQVLQNLDLKIREKKAQITVEALPNLDADETQMTQLLENLVSNAIKFHRPDQPPVVTIASTTLIESHSGNGFVEIRVEDEGVGFDSRYSDRLFEPFERLHPREDFEGTGMGLAICRKIVARHGGEIFAESSPNQGARFIVRLPRSQTIQKE